MQVSSKTAKFMFPIALVLFIGWLDIKFTQLDLVAFFLTPIILGAYLFSLRYGLFLSVLSLLTDFYTHYSSGVINYWIMLDIFVHGLIFFGAVIVVDSLLTQFRAVNNLERKRNYDLDIASKVHQTVFRPVPPENKYLLIANKVSFARELGGDYYYFDTFGDNVFYCVADISGKGIAAALFSSLLHDTIQQALESRISLSILIQDVNERLSISLPEDMFVTMFCCYIDQKEITYINAGHEPPLHYSNEYDKVECLSSDPSLPLGLDPLLILTEKKIQFNKKDILLAVTDGITESLVFRDKPFKKLKDILLSKPQQSAQELVETIYTKVVPNDVTYPDDDIVVTCFKRK